jgi:hypothetical protein
MSKPLVCVRHGQKLGLAGLVASAAFFAACSGNVMGSRSDDQPGSSTSNPNQNPPGSMGSGGSSGGMHQPPTMVTDPGPSPGCMAADPGPSPIRRLSDSEYLNTITDLFGAQALPTMATLVPEARVDGFDNNAQGRTVSDELAQDYFQAAEEISAKATANMASLLPCDPASKGETACLDMFLDTVGKRIWRRPLVDAERENLKQAYAQAKDSTFADGVQAVIQVMLLAPQFMYRIEQGAPVAGADYLALTPYELASRLSYLLWGSTPDDALLSAADGGALASRDDVLTQAKRMLADPRAAKMLGRFTDEWLRLEEIAKLEKEAQVYTTFKPELRDALHTEAQTLFDSVIWQGDGKLDTLLTSPSTYMNGALATYYGVPGVTGDTFQKVSFDPKQRAGFLGQAGLLGVLGVNDGGLTSLVYRGVFVRERLFCEPVPDPPPNAPDMQPAFDPATTSARQWSEARQKIALCGSCHGTFDPIGLGLENFDGVGLFRTTDHGQPVDPSGALVDTDIDGPFSGEPALAQQLTTSKAVHECMATQFFRYGYGREETDRDSCALTSLKMVATSTGGGFKELLLALTQTDTFMLRSKGDQP